MAICSWFSHWKWWFSTATYIYIYIYIQYVKLPEGMCQNIFMVKKMAHKRRMDGAGPRVLASSHCFLLSSIDYIDGIFPKSVKYLGQDTRLASWCHLGFIIVTLIWIRVIEYSARRSQVFPSHSGPPIESWASDPGNSSHLRRIPPVGRTGRSLGSFNRIKLPSEIREWHKPQ